MRFKYIVLILLSVVFVGCGESSEVLFSEFEKHLKNDDYKFAMKVYEDNSNNKKFESKVNEYLNAYVLSMPDITLENYIDMSYEVDFIVGVNNKIVPKEVTDKLINIKDKNSIIFNEKLAAYKVDETGKANKRVVELGEEKKKIEEEKNLLEGDKYYKKGTVSPEAEKEEDKEVLDSSNNVTVAEDNDISYLSKTNEIGSYSFKYPSFLSSTGKTLSGYGEIFENEARSIKLKFDAEQVVNGYQVEDLYEDMLGEAYNPSYKHKGSDYVVVSWAEGDNIIYEYKKIDKDMIKGFKATYDKSESEIMDKIIPIVYESFR